MHEIPIIAVSWRCAQDNLVLCFKLVTPRLQWTTLSLCQGLPSFISNTGTWRNIFYVLILSILFELRKRFEIAQGTSQITL